MNRGGGDIVYEIGGDASSLVAAGAAGAKALRQTDKAAQDVQKQLDRIVQASARYQRQINATIGVNEGFAKSAKASADVFTRDWSKAVTQVDRLKSQLDPLYASSKRYEAALAQLDSAMKRGVITEAERIRLLGLAEQAYLSTGNAAVVSAGKLGGVTAMVRQNRMAVQMMGYQIQDVAVQLAAGTNVMTVFAQQGSQIASIFGPYGAMFGALAAVTLPLLGAAFMSAGDSTKAFTDSVNDLEAAVRLVDDAIRNYSIPGIQDLIEKYGELDGAVMAMVAREREFAIARADNAAVSAVAALADEYGALSFNLDAVGRAAQGQQIQIRNMADSLGLTVDQTRDLIRALQDANSAKDHLARADALGRVAALLLESSRKGDELTGKIVDAEKAMRRLAASVPGAGWLSGMIAQAQSLAAGLWDAAKAKAAATEGAASGGGAADVSRNPFDTQLGTVVPSATGAGGSSGGGGGGGGQDRMQADLERLQQQFMSEAEIQLAAYEEQQALLEQALSKKLITQEEYNALMLDAQREHSQKMSDIDVWRYGDGLDKAEAFMGGMAEVMQSGNQKMLKIGKIFAAAQALISTYQGAAKELEKGVFGFASAAAVIAKGMAFVSAINGAGGGSGGGGGQRGGGRGGGGGTATTGAPQQPLSVRLTEFNPSGLYTGAAISGLLDALTREAGDRGYRLVTAR